MTSPYPAPSPADAPRGHTDIVAGGWIDRWAPPAVEPYLKLMRLDRPIGTWLLLIPCWWGQALAERAGGTTVWGELRLALLFAVGAVVMRGAGCVVNDILDRDIDAKVERTRVRPIPSGRVSVARALAFLAALLLVGLAILVQFNLATVWIGAASLLLVFPYPLMKRITWWPQAFLGLTFNWGALVGWSAVTGSLALPPVVLYAAGVLWTLAYDTVYAHQDKADDALVGVKSSARRLAGRSKQFVRLFHIGAVALIALAGLLAGLNPLFLAPLAAALAYALQQDASWDPDDPADCLAKFKNAKWFALIVLIGLAVGRAA
ncbi:MAG TPA: 4-hydroxybenzoate octaprenyltransferase [Alphaproteobacteria bacterium]|nr:4-hydroxybenzoate octaprenyltransferase [Alphaproteobacteria bacterium]